MKTFLMTTAVLAAMTTASFADDFDVTTFDLVANTGDYDLSVSGDQNEVTDLEFGATSFEYTLGTVSASVRGAVNYSVVDETVGVRGEYNVSTGSVVGLSGSAAVEYVAMETSLENGEFFFDPNVRAGLAITDSFGVFTEVGYIWNMSNDWEELGGYVELGAPVSLSESVTVTPSLVKGYDDGVEELNANVKVAFTF